MANNVEQSETCGFCGHLALVHVMGSDHCRATNCDCLFVVPLVADEPEVPINRLCDPLRHPGLDWMKSK